MAAGNFNHFLALAEQEHKAVVGTVKKTAFNVERGAKVNARKKTGYMRSTIYVDAEGESDYGQGAVEAPAGAELLPKESHERDTQAIVGVGASYGIYQELGTSRMPAHPFLVPAMEAERAAFVEALSRIGEQLRTL